MSTYNNLQNNQTAEKSYPAGRQPFSYANHAEYRIVTVGNCRQFQIKMSDGWTPLRSVAIRG